MTIPGISAAPAIRVERWPTERPLFVLALLVSLVIWLVAAVTVVGLVYAALVGVFFWVVHLAFVAHVRGSGVRLGPDQFPELHASVVRLAGQVGLERVPEAYLMQAGGALNAFATRFLRTHLVVLYSDLLEACGDNTAARDMIIAHELGHIRAGHLRWRWLILPASLVPFLGTALSRAREYTCDRFGLAGAGDRDGAALGLAILAAGAVHGPRVNRQALVRQRDAFRAGWMTIGEWLSTHPPLAKRLAQVDPALAAGQPAPAAGAVRAAGILAAVVLPFVVAGWLAAVRLPEWMKQVSASATAGADGVEAGDGEDDAYTPPPPDVGVEQARADLAALAAFIESERQAGREIPWDTRDLYLRWTTTHPKQAEPIDPFDGGRYGYDQRGGSYIIWSSGPDQESRTADDITYDSRTRAVAGGAPTASG